MAALKPAIALLALAITAPARAQSVAGWRVYTAQASQRFGVPVAWIERVMRVESGGRTTVGGRPIRSPAGAIGLMQLMPDTWTAMRQALGLGADPDDPRDNILAGTFYLRLMYDRFGYPGLFAAYNAGPARYAAALAGSRALPAETIAYLGTVARPSAALTPPATSVRRSALFALRAAQDAPPVAGSKPQPDALFAVRYDDR